MRSLVLVTIVVVGCNVPTITERAPVTGTHRAPDRIPPASIHAGLIRLVAISEQADVALSVDTVGEVRFWPSLDGKREPVQVALAAPRAISIAHAGAELVVGAIDQAGNGLILRLSRDGAVRGTKAIGGEVAIGQLVAIEGGVLVVRADQTIERYDANGTRRGKIVGDPGERFARLAVRRNGAAVLVITGTPKPPPVTLSVTIGDTSDTPRPMANGVRFIVLGDALAADGLSWGPRRVLPQLVDADALALAPNHGRIAVVDAAQSASTQLHVLDVRDLHEIGTPVLVGNTQHPSLGFIDNDDAVDVDITISWWPSPPPPAPNEDDRKLEVQSPSPSVSGGSIGDGVAIAAFTTSLELAKPGTAHFLGWLDAADGLLTAAGSGFALTLRESEQLLLDPSLAIVTHTKSLDPDGLSDGAPLWIDAHRVVIARAGKGHQEISIVDPDSSAQLLSLGVADRVQSFGYDPQLREVAIIDPPRVHRVVVDAAFTKATSLPDLWLKRQQQQIRLVDPATHGGVVAIGASPESSTEYDDDEWHDEPGPLIEPTETQGSGMYRAIDGDGALYVADEHELDVVRGGTRTRLCAATISTTVEPSADGQLIATVDDRVLAMVDARGRELWRRTVWDIERVVFATDARRLVVQTSGGLLELDAMTGERIATSCAFEFGIHDSVPRAFPRNVPTACED